MHQVFHVNCETKKDFYNSKESKYETMKMQHILGISNVLTMKYKGQKTSKFPTNIAIYGGLGIDIIVKDHASLIYTKNLFSTIIDHMKFRNKNRDQII